jgi:hypothetical protein
MSWGWGLGESVFGGGEGNWKMELFIHGERQTRKQT